MNQETIKPEASKWHLVWALFTIYSQEKCPRCIGIAPYYHDCPVCMCFVIGCDKAPKIDVFIKYLSWLKEENI